MNSDIRIAVTLADHHKTTKMRKRLGEASFRNLIKLWCYTAVNKPEGVLTNMDQEDIEIAAGWMGEPGAFVACLLDPKIRFLEQDEAGCFNVHDWEEHQGYASKAAKRSEAAKKAASIRWNKRYKKSGSNATASPSHSGKPKSAMPDDAQSNAPFPSPSPSPVPSPSPKERGKSTTGQKPSTQSYNSQVNGYQSGVEKE